MDSFRRIPLCSVVLSMFIFGNVAAQNLSQKQRGVPKPVDARSGIPHIDLKLSTLKLIGHVTSVPKANFCNCAVGDEAEMTLVLETPAVGTAMWGRFVVYPLVTSENKVTVTAGAQKWSTNYRDPLSQKKGGTAVLSAYWGKSSFHDVSLNNTLAYKTTDQDRHNPFNLDVSVSTKELWNLTGEPLGEVPLLPNQRGFFAVTDEATRQNMIVSVERVISSPLRSVCLSATPHDQAPHLDPHRTILGVGEQVLISASSPSQWSLSPSDGGILEARPDGYTAVYTAPDTPIKNISVTAVMASGTCKTSFTEVIAPTSIRYVPVFGNNRDDKNNPILHPQGHLAFGMRLALFFGPPTVSFRRVKVHEMNAQIEDRDKFLVLQERDNRRQGHCDSESDSSACFNKRDKKLNDFGGSSMIDERYGTRADGALDDAVFLNMEDNSKPIKELLKGSGTRTVTIKHQYAVTGSTAYHDLPRPVIQILHSEGSKFTVYKGYPEDEHGQNIPMVDYTEETNYFHCQSKGGSYLGMFSEPEFVSSAKLTTPACEDIPLWPK